MFLGENNLVVENCSSGNIGRRSALRFFLAPRADGDEEGGGVGGDGDGAEKPNAADQGAYDFGCDHV